MRRAVWIIMVFLLGLSACSKSPSPTPTPTPAPTPSAEVTPAPTPTPEPLQNPDGDTLDTRFAAPAGYERVDCLPGSFALFLRELPLLEDGTAVPLYDGTSAGISAAAVVDLPIGTRDRCQNTDALLLLRAHFLYEAGRGAEIQFHFNSGFLYDYPSFSAGKRVKVDGNKVEWVKSADTSDSVDTLTDYLVTLYAYSRASSLKQDTRPGEAMAPGTMFLTGGGAVIADMAVHPATGETLVLLVRGGDPACLPYLIGNPSEPELDPWHAVSAGGAIYTESESWLLSDLVEWR